MLLRGLHFWHVADKMDSADVNTAVTACQPVSSGGRRKSHDLWPIALTSLELGFYIQITNLIISYRTTPYIMTLT